MDPFAPQHFNHAIIIALIIVIIPVAFSPSSTPASSSDSSTRWTPLIQARGGPLCIAPQHFNHTIIIALVVVIVPVTILYHIALTGACFSDGCCDSCDAPVIVTRNNSKDIKTYFYFTKLLEKYAR